MKIEFPAVFPVIHPVTAEAALASIDIAFNAGADGIFLIDQGMTQRRLLVFVERVVELYPKLPVGVNLLNLYPWEAVEAASKCGARMLWSDEGLATDERHRERFRDARLEARWRGPFFGGVAFKYKEPVPRALIPTAIAGARSHPAIVDVVTTSGDATGSPPDHDKVRLFREALGSTAPLALASGMTPENVTSYVDAGADAFLVATGIESSFGHLDAQKTRDFIARVHAAPRSGRSVQIPDR